MSEKLKAALDYLQERNIYILNPKSNFKYTNSVKTDIRKNIKQALKRKSGK